MKHILFFFCLCFFAVSCNDSSVPKGPIKGPVFSKVSAEKSGVIFNNEIQEDANYNHLKWTHIYSGAGVGLGDINNDGLLDIYFAGNKVNDALYLNKGNFQFEDISASAGILKDGKWSTGVTFADVNGDGYDDIYVCRMSFTQNPEDRRNLLYINNGDNTFSEQARPYGVANAGFSIQSTFFDLDQDGDLDMFLGNQPPDARLVSRFKIDVSLNPESYRNRLYRNTGNNKFEEVAKEYGVGEVGYSLNVMASDINNDGLTDIYVSSDYDSPDRLYINSGKQSFTNTIDNSIRHISNFAMGSDLADYDNNGHLDIAVVDMASADHFRSKTNMGSMRPAQFWGNVAQGKHYQYMFNTLQKNNGNGTFSEVGQIAGISKTDWSWGIVMADFDNDGLKDISVTNGIQRDIRNNDFQNKIRAANARGQKQFNILDVVNLVPSNPISNYLFKNKGDLQFSDVTDEWGFNDPGFSQGMAYGDLDNDGDLDLVISNMGAAASIYNNVQGNRQNYIRFKLEGNAGNHNALNAVVKIKYADQQQVYEITSTRGYLSASEPIAHFGLGTQTSIDEVQIRWPNGKWTILPNPAINKTHTINISSATAQAPAQEKVIAYASEKKTTGLDFVHQENEFDDFEREILIPHKQSENGPFIAHGDINGDGLEDAFIGGAAGFTGKLYLQNTDGTFKPSPNQAWKSDAASEDLGCLFFDYDGDKDLDLYVVSGGSEFEKGDPKLQDRLYKNNGKGNFTKVNLPSIRESGQCVVAHDFDKDGDQDLFIGGRLVPGKYPAPADSYILINQNGSFVDQTKTIAPGLKELGLVTDALFVDYDGDGDDDLIAVGEWMKVSVFENDNNKFEEVTDAAGLSNSRGWWWSVAAADFDKDGDLDLVAGNLGKNTKFKASKEKPFMVYGNDFDNNGTNDVVLANFYGDNVVPVRGRECSSEQMPFIAEKFPTFEGFANANLESILPEEEISKAVKYEIKSFKSVIFKNEGGKFVATALPIEAQFSPLRDFAIYDINGDSNLDILGVGNLYGAEVETMRYDAGIGVCLLGDGKGNFKASNVLQSGFFTPHDARSLAILKGDQPKILVGNNKEKVQVFALKNNPIQ